MQRGRIISFALPVGMAAGAFKAKFMLYNVQGRLVRCWDLSGAQGLTVSMKGCKPGSYFGKLVTGDREYLKHIVEVQE